MCHHKTSNQGTPELLHCSESRLDERWRWGDGGAEIITPHNNKEQARIRRCPAAMLRLGIGAQPSLQHIDPTKQRPWIYRSSLSAIAGNKARRREREEEGEEAGEFYSCGHAVTASSAFHIKRRGGFRTPSKQMVLQWVCT